MKKIIMASFLLAMSGAVQAKPLDRIVAIVDHEPITQSQLQQQISVVTQQFLTEHATPPPEEKIKQQALQHLIDEKLQMQLAKSLGMTASDSDMNRAISQIAKENHMTTEQLYMAVQEQGITREQYHQKIKTQIIVGQLQQRAVGHKVSVSNKEINVQLQRMKNAGISDSAQYHLQDIIITNEAQANELLGKLKSSKESFESFPVSDLGWRGRNELPTLFDEQLPHMKVGEIVGPLHAPNGFHLLRLIGKRNNNVNQTQQVDRELARKLVYQQKFITASQEWLKELRKQNYVRIQ